MGRRVRMVTVYVEEPSVGQVRFVSKWHGHLEECVTEAERRRIEGLLDGLCACLWEIMLRDAGATVGAH